MNFFDRVRLFGAAITGKALDAGTSSFLRGESQSAGNLTRLDQPYGQSAWVRAAVNHIAGEISGRPLKFYSGEQEFDNLQLAEWWAKPALGPKTRGVVQPRLPISDVLRDLSAWASLEGEFFICLDDAWLLATASRTPQSPFLVARPDRMRLVVAGGELQGYEYTATGGRRLVFLPEQVIHWKAFNPHDDWRGMGAMRAASVAAEGAFSTGIYIRDLMRNNGDQGFIVIGKGGVVTDPQKEAIVADLRAKRSALRRGVAMDLFMTGDVSVERPPERAASTDLNVGKGMSHQEIFVAFGIPPSMCEVKASYSIGKESDYYQLITRTCQPQGVAIASALASVASRQAGQELNGELEWDDHPVMIEVRNSRIEVALKLWGVGMPMKQANDYLGLGMNSFTGWEVGYLPFSVAAVGSDSAANAAPIAPATDPSNDPALAEPPAEDPAVEQLRLVLLSRQRNCQRVQSAAAIEPEFKVFSCTCHGEDGVSMKGRSESEIRLWKSHMSQRMETLKTFESGIRRELMDARGDTLWKLTHVLGKSVTKAAAADIVFDKEKFKSGLLATMRKREQAALEKAGQQLYTELGKDDPFKYPPAKALDFLRERENRLGDASDAIHSTIKSTLEDGLNAGETQEQLASRVRSAFNGIADGRARTIAATEVAVCYGVARDTAMQEAGVPFKGWLTSGNSNVRAAHAAANGQTVPLDEPFVVDGEQLMHPGDPSGSAGNVINCHCVSIAKAE